MGKDRNSHKYLEKFSDLEAEIENLLYLESIVNDIGSLSFLIKYLISEDIKEDHEMIREFKNELKNKHAEKELILSSLMETILLKNGTELKNINKHRIEVDFMLENVYVYESR